MIIDENKVTKNRSSRTVGNCRIASPATLAIISEKIGNIKEP
jgi:hypothetical protein